MFVRLHQRHRGLSKRKSKGGNLIHDQLISPLLLTVVKHEFAYKFAYRQPIEPLSFSILPEHPRDRVGVDTFQHVGKQ